MSHIHAFTKASLSLAATLLAGLTLAAQPYPDAVNVLQNYESRPGVRTTALLRDLETGETILSYRAGELFCPASLMKIPTTGAFLHAKGPDYRFTIPIMKRGRVKNGVLEGDIILSASADPSLGSHYIPHPDRLLNELAQLLHSKGIQQISGRVILDLKGYPSPFYSEQWPDEDLGHYYGAPVSGFNIADNYADLYLYSSGQRPEVVLRIAGQEQPHMPTIYSSNTTSLGLLAPDGADSILIKGSMRAGFSGMRLRHPLSDPPRIAAQWISEGLRQRGIMLGQAPSVNYKGEFGRLDKIGSYASLPADTIIKITNFRSSNIYAEALAYSLNTPLQRSFGEPVAMRDFWLQRLKLVPSSFIPHDGSGLSPAGRITAITLSQILNDLWLTERTHNAFLASLPRAGYEGSVRSVALPAGIMARIKSGSMRTVKGYAGYIWAGDKWYSLVYIANGAINQAEAKNAYIHFVTRLFTRQPVTLPSYGRKAQVNLNKSPSKAKAKPSSRRKK